MSGLESACPGCGTSFRVAQAQIEAAGGLVRCGGCDTVFDAREHAITPHGRASEPTPASINEDYITGLIKGEMPVPVPVHALAPAAASPPQSSGTPSVPTVIVEATVAQVPVELQGGAPTDPGLRLRRLIWAAGILVALLLVLAQQLWLGRAQGMQDPRWRPRYQSLCEVIGCELAPYRDLRRLRSDGLLVRPDPARPGLLLLDAVIVNKAVFPQAFPGLELAFSDIQGSPVMTRVFRPEEYLGGAALREGAMQPGEPVTVHLEIPDPGEQATNYELRLTELSGH